MAQDLDPHAAPDDRPDQTGAGQTDLAALLAEVEQLRRSRANPTLVRELEHRIAAQASSMATLSAQNERLVRTLKDARG